MFRTCGHSLKLEQVSCWSAKVKVLNRLDVQTIFRNLIEVVCTGPNSDDEVSKSNLNRTRLDFSKMNASKLIEVSE